MARPGTSVTIRETPPALSVPTDTGVWFVVGFAEKGSLTTPRLVRNMAEFVKYFGSRQSNSYLYDSLDVFFQEGGSRAYVQRVFGPTPVAASHVFLDGSSGQVFRAEAINPGTWGNSLNVAILAGTGGGQFKIQVTDDVLGTLETSPDLDDKAGALAWAANSAYITLVSLASALDPATIAATSLASGTDDSGSATDSQWKTAILKFDTALGPGQVSMPGRTTDQAHIDLLDHASSHRRTAILDFPDTATKATLEASAAAARANGRFGGGFAPWLLAPGFTPNTTRPVPPSALVAAKCARVDATENPNQPAAGARGQAFFCLGVTQAGFSDADREEMNGLGINIIREVYNTTRVYGWRSLADPVADPNWVDLGNARLVMGIGSKADVIAEGFTFAEIDGQRTAIARFGGELRGMMNDYFQAGAVFGRTPDEAFLVDTGEAVNTPETLAALELHAVIAFRPSPFAELVVIEVVRKNITESV